MQKTKAHILVVDDDPDVLTTARLFLKHHFTQVDAEKHPRELNGVLSKSDVDLILLDMNFTKGDNDGREGIYWLNHIKEVSPDTLVILMTAYGDVELAVSAIKRGATDFVLKPWKNEKLLATINSALQLRKSNKKVTRLEETRKSMEQDRDRDLGEFIGESEAMLNLMKTIEKVGTTDANVLILGENGTGKTLVARALHRASLRNNEAFIHVDLGALNENLFESELFGHKKGAFTDAHQDRAGRFELADTGTLFLDEIGNLPLHLQAKMLTVLQDRKLKRLGDTKEFNFDVRLICATNMPIHQHVDNGEFRQDLLYRINTVELVIPPLRERVEDIPILVDHFLKRYGKKYNKLELSMSKEVMSSLMDYHWPGNIRELEHAIERMVILSDSSHLTSDMVNFRSAGSDDEALDTLNLDDMERYLIDKAIRKHKGNISKAASDLGLTRAALYRRLEKHGI
ncbi:sigma-54-dependent transcriptional regulator [Phaeocystidibacter luteus]|uniref:Sigma-54-dependent Fis family transcriptional regulator n=1 Tax=Phaeocystidibacter luteus TaxID=911197 RepID=A0A6N6RID8_9FLAO|nr:sigma-54 dependent transcriptional regulator [Phaeocystidibacter luteus]KAB2813727.1 sigma-54-dependent Fis family transcriptional regulator [Phaeocystidibacter luteus]